MVAGVRTSGVHIIIIVSSLEEKNSLNVNHYLLAIAIVMDDTVHCV